MGSESTRKRVGLPWPVVALAVIAVVVALIAAVFSRGADALEAEGTPEAPSTAEADLGVAVPAATPEGYVTYQIDSANSTASYSAEEELGGFGANTAVGTTNAIIGQLLMAADGAPIAGSRVDIDLRTLTSDETRRDNTLRTRGLESDTYPIATFIVTAVENWTGPLAEGQTSQFVLVGNLTVHGVTREVKWDATGTMDGDSLKGTAELTVKMSDFNIEAPTNAMVLSIDDEIKLNLDLTATPAS